MYKITKKYEDFNGVEKEEDFYFNLTKADVLKMELSEDGGMDKRLERLIKTKDMKEAIKVFEGLLLMAYGEKTDDGRFIKNDEIRARFTQSAAYSEIFTELAMDPDKAQEFVNGVVPKFDNPVPAPAVTQKH
ncbi:MAG: hypothetical protein J6U54_12350 [Clostridiales bacterium]|nr:hypothetical protein [Clostridiales bacterium]